MQQAAVMIPLPSALQVQYVSAHQVRALEPTLLALWRPSAQAAAARLEALLLPRLRPVVVGMLERAPPRWARPHVERAATE